MSKYPFEGRILCICLLQLGFAFMISTFISKSSSATTFGFSIFIIGFLTQVRLFSVDHIELLNVMAQVKVIIGFFCDAACYHIWVPI